MTKSEVGKSIALSVVALLLAVSFPAEAQQPKKASRIGLLSGSGPTTNTAYLEAFRQGLRELGYIEGENILLEYRWAEGKSDRLPGLAAELVGLRADIILTIGTQANLAAWQASNTIPIVVAGAGDLVGAGLVESLARPGGNVTGLTTLNRELAGKRLELFKEAVPKLARVAVLYNPTIPRSVREVKEILPVAARAL